VALKTFFVIGTALSLSSCNPEATGLVVNAYHDVTSKYNYYYLALEKTKELEVSMWDKNVDDYNKVLRIYPKYDSTTAKGFKTQCDAIIKKASHPIQWHKPSVWVDNCYVLIGKSRFYAYELKNALETFKYVNTKSNSTYERQEALTMLIHTYMEMGEMQSAEAVVDFLKKEKINEKIKPELFLTMAHYYAKLDEPNKTLAFLKEANKRMNIWNYRKDYRSRIKFIIGQLSQQAGDDSTAYISYEKCLKLLPPYEMQFNCQLNMAQTAELSDKRVLKKLYKTFEKMLAEAKNEEFKDKIYYELGRFDLKQNKITSAISNFKKCAKHATKNPYNKAYAYLALGKIYYEKKKDFELAKLYYDSTVITLPKDHKDYKAILKRKGILDEFVKELTIYRLEDSLQRMVHLDTAALNKKIAGMMERDRQKIRDDFELKKKQEKEAARAAFANAANSANSNLATLNQPTTPSGQNPSAFDPTAGKFYFYRPEVVASGKQEFQAKWGNRPLEDFWRLSTRDGRTSSSTNTVADTSLNSASTKQTKTLVDDKPNDKDLLAAALATVKKENYIKDLPTSPEKMASSEKRLKKSMYNLGKIYKLKLEERDNGIDMFENLIKRYPTDSFALEAMYFLYIMYKNPEGEKSAEADLSRAEYYKTRILNEFPDSFYAHIILNPNYVRESNEKGKVIERKYKAAYSLYENRQYGLSDTAVTAILSEYTETDIQDKLWLLKIMAIGKQEKYTEYEEKLKWYIGEFKKSPLKPFAQTMLDKHGQLMEAVIKDKTKKRHVIEIDFK
jgi:hypothetical protein